MRRFLRATRTVLRRIPARICFYHFVILAGVIVSIDSLDGVKSSEPTEPVSFLRMVAALYVFVGGLFILHTLFVSPKRARQRPGYPLVLAWSLYGAGMFCWGALAQYGFPIFFIIGLGAIWQAIRLARGAPIDARELGHRDE